MPRNLFAEVTVPVPDTVQPMAMVALMATPPSREPWQEFAVPLARIPNEPVVVVPMQFVTLVALRPLPLVEVPRQFIAILAVNPTADELLPVEFIASNAISPAPPVLVPVQLLAVPDELMPVLVLLMPTQL